MFAGHVIEGGIFVDVPSQLDSSSSRRVLGSDSKQLGDALGVLGMPRPHQLSRDATLGPIRFDQYHPIEDPVRFGGNDFQQFERFVRNETPVKDSSSFSPRSGGNIRRSTIPVRRRRRRGGGAKSIASTPRFQILLVNVELDRSKVLGGFVGQYPFWNVWTIGQMIDKRNEPKTPSRMNQSEMIDKVAALSRKLNEDEVLSTMSPATEAQCLEAIKTERRSVLDEMKKNNENK